MILCHGSSAGRAEAWRALCRGSESHLWHIFCATAEVAQLIERILAKDKVAGLSPVFRLFILGCGEMASRQVLVLKFGVRIPASQLTKESQLNQHFSSIVDYGISLFPILKA